MRTRVWVRFAAWLLTAGLVVACGGGAQPVPQPAPGGSPTGQSAAGAMVIVDGDPVGDQALIDAAKKEGSVTLYTAGVTTNEQQLGAAFLKRFGVKVEIVREVGGRLHERLMTEAKASKNLADVVHQSDVSLTDAMIREGLVAANKVPVHDKYPAGFRDDNGNFYTTLVPLMAISYNTEMVKANDVPKSWKDLLNPKWKGQIGMTYAGIGGTGWSLAYYWRKELGEQYWRDMAAQKVIIYQSAANVSSALAKGEIALAVNADVNDYGEMSRGAPVDTVYPAEGAPAATYSMVVTKNAPHPNAARLFINWYTSAEAQKINGQLGTYSARKDLPAPPKRPPVGQINVYGPKDRQEFIQLRDSWVKEWNTVFGYR